MGKDKGKGFSFWKLIFTLVFLVLAALWIIYTIFYFGWWTSGWDFVKNWPVINTINDYINSQMQGTTGIRIIGVQMLLISVAILLVYGTIFFPIKKLPILGSILKMMTTIIPTVATVVFIIACVFIWGNIDLGRFQNLIPSS